MRGNVNGDLGLHSCQVVVGIGVPTFTEDIDQNACKGVYPRSTMEDVRHSFLATDFTPSEDGYDITAIMRETRRLSNAGTLEDTPISRIGRKTCITRPPETPAQKRICSKLRPLLL
jgi:hypothetical protein